MTQEALKELLEAVEAAIQAGDWKVDGACDPDLVIRRAKEALAQPEQEPVACIGTNGELMWLNKPRVIYSKPQPLYTAPPQQEPVIDKSAAKRIATSLGWTSQRKPLTDEQIMANDVLRYHFALNGGAGPISKKGRKVIDAIEAAHGIKENT